MTQELTDTERAQRETERTVEGAMDEAERAGNEMSGSVSERIESGSNRVGDVAEKAAGMLRDRATMADGATDKMASRLESASEYLHQGDADTFRQDVGAYIKKHPFQALVIGAVGGYLVSKVLL